MKHVSTLLDPTLRRMGVRSRVRLAQVDAILASLLGPELSALCRPLELRRGVLILGTLHGGLAHQLQLDSTQLITALNRSLGADAIKRLSFRPLEPTRR